MNAQLERVSRSAAPSVVHEVLRTPGMPLDSSVRRGVERQFHHDFSRVRVHAGARATESARSVGALAYTVGSDVVFGPGGYAPHTATGRSLLAHELTHVLHNDRGGTGGLGSGSGHTGELTLGRPDHASEAEAAHAESGALPSASAAASGPVLRRAVTLGTKVTEPKGAPAPFKTVTGRFNGAKFTLVGDGKTIVEADGQSGHPNQVTAADAKLCKGSPDDSYLNNVRYVGIKDKGPIPEGEFSFLHSAMVTFSAVEDAKMALATPGSYADPSGLDLHGDWGAARVALTPLRIEPSRFGGNTATRSGFYLHGGIMTGSSGCIDIGNTGVTSVVDKLMGYLKPVHVTVKYTVPPPTTGVLDRAAGRFMYPGKKTGFWDRVGSVFGGGSED